MKKKIALITGITGQDGSYLARALLKKNYDVHGLVRRSSVYKWQRLSFLKILDKLNLRYGEVAEKEFVQKLIKDLKPNFIFNLAAQSFVQYSFDNPSYTYQINFYAVKNIVECIKKNKLDTRFYQASTSEMFGNTNSDLQSEKTKFCPVSPYATSKLEAHRFIQSTRKKTKNFFCSGILFNHESPLRGAEFVTKKIIGTLVGIKKGEKTILELGNIYAKRDWGYAEDHVKAMLLMMEANKADDFVVGTGQSITVKDFIFKVCDYLNMPIVFEGSGLKEKCLDKKTGKLIIKINKKYFRKKEVVSLKADPKKIKKQLGWKAETNVDKLIRIMIEGEEIIRKQSLKYI